MGIFDVLFGKQKTTVAPTNVAAPSATSVESADLGTAATTAEKQRKKKGLSSTQLSDTLLTGGALSGTTTGNGTTLLG